MKKGIVSLMMMLTLLCGMGFSYSMAEAATDPALENNGLYHGSQILMGTWVDCDNGRTYHFSTGTTTYKGWEWDKNNRDILFSDRGANFALRATWYPDQEKYYAKLFIRSNEKWNTQAECLLKTSDN